MCILINKIFDDGQKILIYMMDLLCQIEILLLNMLKLFKILGFTSFFFKISQIPGFFRFPGFLAAL